MQVGEQELGKWGCWPGTPGLGSARPRLTRFLALPPGLAQPSPTRRFDPRRVAVVRMK